MNRIESVKISGKVLPDELTDELIYSYITVSEDNDIDKTTSTIIEQGNDDTFYTNSNPKIPTLKHTFIKTANYVSTQSIKLSQHNISKQIKDKSKQEIKNKILRQMSRRIVLNTPLENKPSNEEIRLSQRNSYFNKAKKIFQKFLCIGIDESGLDTIEDMDELMLMPKITFNYPNNFNAVKVKRFYVGNDEEFINQIFERNFYSKIKCSFCLLQQVTPDDEKKYFIFGVKFDDLYIVNSKNKNTKNVFIYEKTYVFISVEPLCKLFEQIITFILNYKKLNFYQQLEEYSSLLNSIRVENFAMKNSEHTSPEIINALEYFNTRSYPRKEEYVSYQSPLTKISMNYTHPNKSNECFLAMHYLSYHMFTLITGDILYELLLRVLTEQNIIFITDNIEYLTSLVLGFYYLIQPFKWPFIIIPNLPLDLIEIIESPVPFLIGLLIEPQKIDLYLSKRFIEENNCNIIIYTNNQLKFINKVQLNFFPPDLGHMKQIISQNISQIHFYASSKLNDDYVQACEQLYKNIYGIIKENIAEEIEKCLRIENIFGFSNSQEFTSESIRKYRSDSFDIEYFNSYDKFNSTNYEDEYKKYLQNIFIMNQKKENKSFAKVFVETQIFASYVDDIIDRFKRCEDY